MTLRSPTDAYLSPPCSALGLGRWLVRHCDQELATGHWADIFAGAGSLLEWTLFGLVPLSRIHAFEQDRRWGPELRARVPRARFCDSFALPDWSVSTTAGLAQPHIVTNKPYARTPEGVLRLATHARTTQRWACALMRTDWWQHAKREAVRPDKMLMLSWRPAFGWRRDSQTGRLVWSTDRFTGYVWAVWAPVATGRTELEFLEKPDVPRELVLEHKRLARMAFDFSEAA